MSEKDSKAPQKAPALGELKGYDLSRSRVTRRQVLDGGAIVLRVEIPAAD